MIMKAIKYIIGSLLFVSLLTGCKSEEDFSGGVTEEGEGQILASSIALDIISEALSTRSVGTPTADDFTIEICRSSNENIAAVKMLYSQLPEVLTLPVGSYTVKAYYGDPDIAAAFDAPYFYGEVKDVNVQANKIVDVDPIECKPANVKVSIIFDETLRKEMSEDSKVVVKVGESGELTFTATTESAGYFKYVENSNTLAANFIGEVQGEDFNVIKTYSDVQPGYYYQITFKLNVMDPGMEEDPNQGEQPGDPNGGQGDDTRDPQEPENPSTPDDPQGPGNSGDNNDPGADNPSQPENPGSDDKPSNSGSLKIDATVIYTVNTEGGEESLDPDFQEYLKDGNSWDFSGDHPFDDDDVTDEPNVEDKVPEVKPDPSDPDDGNEGNGGNGQGGNTKPDEPSDPTPEQPVMTPPQVVSDDVDLNTVTNITGWPDGKRLEIKILSKSKIKKFICNIESEQLNKETLEGIGLSDELDLVNENDLWPTLRGLGFPVGSDVTDPQEVDADGNYVIHFSLTNEVDGFTFVYLLNALGAGTHKFVFHLENEAGESTATLALECK